MKALIANWVYNWGSTGYILRDLKEGLTECGWEVITACGINKGIHAEDIFEFSTAREMQFYHRLSRLGWPKFSGSPMATQRLIHKIEEECPDIIHLHLLHCGCLNLYNLLKYLGMHHIKTVITHHAELYYTGSCGHSYYCKNFISEECRGCQSKKMATGAYIGGNPHLLWKRMKTAMDTFCPKNIYFTAVSPWVKQRMTLSPITQNVCCDVVMNGIDTSIFHHHAEHNLVVKRFGDHIQNYVVHVTAMFDPTDKENIKGGFFVAELARRMPYIHFVVVATDYCNCEELPDNLYFWGKAQNQKELSELYVHASVTLLTSKRETFSMVT